MKKQLTTGWLIERGFVHYSILLPLFLPVTAGAQPIGVAFIQPGTHGGYRIIIAPAEYQY